MRLCILRFHSKIDDGTFMYDYREEKKGGIRITLKCI